MGGASILEIEPCSTTFLRIVMTSSKYYIMDEKSSIKVLTSTFNPTTLSSMNLSWDSKKFYCTRISSLVWFGHRATVPLSPCYSPSSSSSLDILSLKVSVTLPPTIRLLVSDTNCHRCKIPI